MSMDFSSWPRDQEQQFVVFEQRQQESHRKAFMAAIIASVAFLVLALGVYAGVEPEHKDMTKGMNMENLTKKSKKVEAPAPAPAPAATPEAAAPEAPAPEAK
jgi:flagellar biosynthesis/type III secretory pathway M-ring protein FliF/YscJ